MCVSICDRSASVGDRFKELLKRQRIGKQPDGSCAYNPANPVTFTALNVPPVPLGGYSYADYQTQSGEMAPTMLERFDTSFTLLVNSLQDAWNAENSGDADQFLESAKFIMMDLPAKAGTIMQIALPSGAGVFCPNFRYQNLHP